MFNTYVSVLMARHVLLQVCVLIAWHMFMQVFKRIARHVLMHVSVWIVRRVLMQLYIHIARHVLTLVSVLIARHYVFTLPADTCNRRMLMVLVINWSSTTMAPSKQVVCVKCSLWVYTSM